MMTPELFAEDFAPDALETARKLTPEELGTIAPDIFRISATLGNMPPNAAEGAAWIGARLQSTAPDAVADVRKLTLSDAVLCAAIAPDLDSAGWIIQTHIGQDDGGVAGVYFSGDSEVLHFNTGNIPQRCAVLGDYVRTELVFMLPEKSRNLSGAYLNAELSYILPKGHPDPRLLPSDAETVARLADAFSRVLGEWLTPEELAEVRRRNATPEYGAACASHDFCDSNMAMDSAWESTFQRPALFPSECEDADGNPLPEAQAVQAHEIEIWNRAWTLAKAGGFTPAE